MSRSRVADEPTSHERIGPLSAGRDRDELIGEVARALARLDEDTPVVVACSGGPDSTALLHLVAEARPDLDLLAVVVRHGLRDDTADVDNVRRHAAWVGAACEVVEVEVVPSGQGLEAAARDARYAALRQAARRHGARVLLVGHTADDQAETVLLRAARGTGVDGLAAMRPVSEDVWRPLLALRRVDVHRFVHFEGLPVASDPTNVDPSFRRNVVRHEVLAELEQVGDDPVGALCRLADLAAADVEVLEALASEQHDALARHVGDLVVLPARALLRLPDGLARRVMRRAIATVARSATDAVDVTRALALKPQQKVSLPGAVEIARSARWLTVAPRLAAHQAPATLTVPGAVAWRPAMVAVQAITSTSDPWRGGGEARRSPGQASGDNLVGQIAMALPDAWQPPPPGSDLHPPPPGGQRDRMVLALPDLDGSLTVRRRQEGDRIATAGGTRSLQDVLVDADVPRAVREIWPVVAVDDRIIWVPGVTADAEMLHAGRIRPVAQLRITSTDRRPGHAGAALG